MNRLINKANKKISIGGAAILLSAASLTGTVLGILRVDLLNKNFSLAQTDAYFAAFKIPDFMYFTLAAGALGVAFLPVLADRLAEGDRKKAWELSVSLLNFLALLTGVASLILIVFAPVILRHVVAPNYDAARLHMATDIMRLVAVNPFIFAISTVLSSVQQAFGRFFFYAIAPLFYNSSIIASIFIFKHSLGIRGVAVGVMIGSLLQLGVIMFGMFGTGFKYRMEIIWKSISFRQVLRVLPARSIDQGVDYLNAIAETRFASRLGTGAVTHYENALTLHNAPIQLIGTAVSTAAFPRFTERMSQGRPDLFRKEFLEIIRAMIWIAAPVVVVTFFGRGYLARIIFGKEAPEIAAILGYLVVAIFFRTMYTIISRYYYAHKDTKTPLFVSLFVIALNIFLAATLSRPQNEGGYGVVGLALAQSVVAAVEIVILVGIMLYRDPKLFNASFWGGVSKIISVTGFSSMAAFIMANFFPLNLADRGIGLTVKVGCMAVVTIFIHVLLSSLFKLQEVQPILQKLRNLVLRPVKIDY